jgi:cohesin complex subunit SA-1/2
MATRDSDAAVRAVAIELLDVLREAGFLEPDDIDSIGRLIFDAEPRVRKAVVNFFAENVNDAYESRIEDLGGQEAVDEAIGPLDPDDEDFDSPRLEWLKMKCLVEMLQAYDAQDEVEPNEAISIPGTDAYMLVPNMESRFSLAAEVLCERIPELNWEILAGYLLHDHSSIPAQGRVANGSDSDLTVLFKQEVKLGEKEEVLLLEVLNAGVRLGLTDLSSAAHDKSKRLTKAQKMAEQEVVDSGSRHLASVIPRLLSKFGALPDAASAVLRLQHVLVPENQDSTAYGALLENVRKQFLAHAQPNVLEEASLAFLHARTGETDEIAAGKVTSLAEDAIDKISILAKGRDLSKRGNLNDTMLAVLDGTVLRLEKLGRIEDICDLLETKTPFPKKKNAAPQPAPVDALLTLLDRGIPTEDDADPVISAQEDSVTLHTTRALGFYFLWKVLALRKQVVTTPVLPLSTLETLAERKERFIDAITKILRIRTGAEEIRLVLTGALIDLHVAFASLLNVKPAKRRQTAASASAEPGDLDSGEPSYEALATEVPKKTQTLLLHILSAAEKSFAKRSKYSLKIPAEDQDEAAAPATDEEPEADSDAELADDEDIDSEAGPGTSADPEVRLAARLGAEQRLCEFAGKLVLGIWAGVIDGKAEGGGGSDKSRAVSKRLKRNRARLGANFKAVVDALERGGPGAGGRGGARKKTSAAAEKKVPQKKGGAGDGAKSKAIVVESDSEVDGNEADQELEDLLREDSPEKDDDVEEAGAAEAEVESLLGD